MRTDVVGFERMEYELTLDAIELGFGDALPAVFEIGKEREFGRGERSQNDDFDGDLIGLRPRSSPPGRSWPRTSDRRPPVSWCRSSPIREPRATWTSSTWRTLAKVARSLEKYADQVLAAK